MNKQIKMIIKIKTHKRREIIDITDLVRENIKIRDGILFLFIPHTTTAITINEYEPNLIEDFYNLFERIMPTDYPYKHNLIDNNADAHLLASLFGHSIFIPVENNDLQLGTWQRVLFLEFDGPRERKIIIKHL